MSMYVCRIQRSILKILTFYVVPRFLPREPGEI